MRFGINYAKLHHCVISEALSQSFSFQINQQVNFLSQGKTNFVHKVHLSAKTAKLCLVTGDWPFHRWPKLPVAA